MAPALASAAEDAPCHWPQGETERREGEVEGREGAGPERQSRRVQREWALQGRVVRVRRLSRRLLFFDLVPLAQPTPLHAHHHQQHNQHQQHPDDVVAGPWAGQADPDKALARHPAGIPLPGPPQDPGHGPPPELEPPWPGQGSCGAVEVALKWPLCEDVRGQGKAVREGALVLAQGSCMDLELLANVPEPAPAAAPAPASAPAPVPAPALSQDPHAERAPASPWAGATWLALASHVTRLVEIPNAAAEGAAEGGAEGGAGPSGPESLPSCGGGPCAPRAALGSAGYPVLRPVVRDAPWNVLLPLPLPLPEGAGSGDQGAGPLWEIMGQAGEGYPVALQGQGGEGGRPVPFKGHGEDEEEQWSQSPVLHFHGAGTGQGLGKWAADSGSRRDPEQRLADTRDGENEDPCLGFLPSPTRDRGPTGNKGPRKTSPGSARAAGCCSMALLAGVCKAWLNSGRCPALAAGLCPHEHPPPSSLASLRMDWVGARQANRAAIRSADPRDPHSEGGKQGRHARAEVFAEWLVQEFGAAGLGAERGVLDVAGGRGLLSFFLSSGHGVPCTVVDPRPRKLSRAEFRHLQHTRGGKGPQGIVPWDTQGVGKGGDEEGEIENFSLLEEDDQKQQEALHESMDADVPMEPRGQEGSQSSQSGAVLLHRREEFYAFKPQWRQGAGEYSCLVGLHPDEVTGDIVFAAAANRKPFAVVPCCVFPGRFQKRVIGGRRVEDVDDLCAYLKELCRQNGGSPQEAWLNFKGRNKVIFCKKYAMQRELVQ